MSREVWWLKKRTDGTSVALDGLNSTSKELDQVATSSDVTLERGRDDAVSDLAETNIVGNNIINGVHSVVDINDIADLTGNLGRGGKSRSSQSGNIEDGGLHCEKILGIKCKLGYKKRVYVCVFVKVKTEYLE